MASRTRLPEPAPRFRRLALRRAGFDGHCEAGLVPAERKLADRHGVPGKYDPGLRERAVRLVFESGRPIAQVARDLGIGAESLRGWVRQAEADAGSRSDRLTSDERERLKALERESRELRQANEILKEASVFLAKELDGTPRR